MKLTRESSTQAPGAGTTLLSNTFNLKGTANALQTATLAYNYRRRKAGTRPLQSVSMIANDRLSLKITGVVTSAALAGLTLTLYATPGTTYPFVHKSIYLNANIATQYIYLANNQRTITGVSFVWATKASGSGTITMDITKESSTMAPGAGTSILAAAVSVNSATTANTVTSPALSGTASVLSLAAGDRLSLKTSGTLTGLAGLYMIVTFAPTFERYVDITLSSGPNGLQADQAIWIADRAYEVSDMSEVHGTAAGAALKGLLTKDTGTTAPGAGTALQTDNTNAGFDLNGTANTVQVGTLSTLRARTIAPGDRIGWKHSAAIGASLANVCATLTLRPL